MASQAYLDAVRDGSFTDPAGWTALADLWELAASPSYTADEARDWVNVKIEVPVFATVLISRGITPEDMALIAPYFTPQAPLPLELAVGAIGVIKGVAAAGGNINDDQAVAAAVNEFFNELTAGGVQLVVV